MRKWCKNGVTAKTLNAETPWKSRKIEGEWVQMKLGIVESEPVSEALRKRTNADKAW